MRPISSVLVVAVAAATLAAALGAQSAESSLRFRDPAHITGDPTGLRFDPTTTAYPRFPRRALAADQAAAIVVAFVVDTRGRIELPTASILNDVEPEFRRAVCEMLPRLRLLP